MDITTKADEFLIKSVKNQLINKIPYLNDLVIYLYGDKGYATWFKFVDSDRVSYTSCINYTIEELIEYVCTSHHGMHLESIQPGYIKTPSLPDIINKFEAKIMFEAKNNLPDYHDEEEFLDYPIKILIEGCSNNNEVAFFKIDDIEVIPFVEILNRAKFDALLLLN